MSAGIALRKDCCAAAQQHGDFDRRKFKVNLSELDP